ncbi:MAG: phosphoadenylyl-sulfate reductase [Gammaproteobacteria bacterium]|jgi:phosphoadenosine phosphosulfate reductase|nr:phosphoadenylyl-sulfate reductase [Gammaproteobacteria bacterium]|tara:strand:+ start:1657 stop:2385 length:729 start_codon:yes stop_codon:yes gene_type:complete
MLSLEKIKELNIEIEQKTPKEILAKVFQLIPNCAISFSGAEDVVLIEMAVKINKDIAVFTLDTGRLHPETYQFIEKVRKYYGITIEVLRPDSSRLQKLTADKGLYSFYEDGHEECCSICKTAPLEGKLSKLDGWITGQRHDQSPTRSHVAVFEADASFSTETRALTKVNPLANWTSAQVWEYIRMFDVPYNELHDRGFVSIGCEPCTRPIGPNQHEREGRWWWEEATIKECGLHRSNLDAET